ncbi:MAG TPA: hotdog fold thioesterase [Caldithrix abyssi]|uniref:Hotdog fold thioesterase n=1 Tax=Caldithrix abyssi TaxID=187145 RepID=A0A7V1LN59_CALAY|nr:hotdog fold thioesterase [Caldithrix abyssi]
MIWFKKYTLAEINGFSRDTMLSHLGIEYTTIEDNALTATMPVDHRTKQPAGILHGGASVALAESVASVASYLTLDPQKFYAVGLEINANHIKSKRQGLVYGKATPVHLGSSTQVWNIDITDEAGRLICKSRITMLILEKKGK